MDEFELRRVFLLKSTPTIVVLRCDQKLSPMQRRYDGIAYKTPIKEKSGSWIRKPLQRTYLLKSTDKISPFVGVW